MKNFIKYLQSYLRILTKERVPLKVSHHLTYDCNLNCSFCERQTNHQENISTQKTKEIMKGFKQEGTLFWSFNGGEPLLREDIGNLVDQANELGFFSSLVTNGTLISEQIEQIKNIDQVQISVDGYQSTHNSIRGRGIFEKITENIELLQEHDIPVQTMTVLNKKNSSPQEIKKLIEWGDNKNVRLNFQPVYQQIEDEEGQSKKLFPEREKMVQTINELIKLKGRGAPIITSKSYLEGIKSSWPEESFQKCWAGKLSCNLTPAGYLAPCCEKLTEHTDLQVNKETVREAFDKLPDMSECAACYSNFEMELSLLLNNRPSSTLKAVKNLITGDWIWS